MTETWSKKGVLLTSLGNQSEKIKRQSPTTFCWSGALIAELDVKKIPLLKKRKKRSLLLFYESSLPSPLNYTTNTFVGGRIRKRCITS